MLTRRTCSSRTTRLQLAGAGLVLVVVLAACNGTSHSAEHRARARSTAPTSLQAVAPVPTTSTTLAPPPPSTVVPTPPIAAATECPSGDLDGAVRSSSVAGINSIPPSDYTVADVRTASSDSQWAYFALAPTPPAEMTLQGGYGIAQCAGGSWSVVDFGSADVGCSGVPAAILSDFGLGCSS
jgi:hypothetical protein